MIFHIEEEDKFPENFSRESLFADGDGTVLSTSATLPMPFSLALRNRRLECDAEHSEFYNMENLQKVFLDFLSSSSSIAEQTFSKR